MIANYHSHTYRCHHASGTETEYVEAAINRGLEIFGFSDHTPQYFPGDYYSFMRMYPQELEDYCNTVRNLQKQYQGKIEIPLGLEAEYYPATWTEMLARAKDAGVEYLILGQHWLGNEENEHGSGAATADEALLKRYCHQVMDGLETGKFTYLAHPDLIHFRGDERTYRKHMRLICTEAKRCGIPLEVNMLGKMLDRNYPNPVFWELAAEEGCDVILGCDAHAPEHLLREDTERQLLAMIRSYGLNLLEKASLRNIK